MTVIRNITESDIEDIKSLQSDISKAAGKIIEICGELDTKGVSHLQGIIRNMYQISEMNGLCAFNLGTFVGYTKDQEEK